MPTSDRHTGRSRRQLLKRSGLALTTVGLAGCSGSGDSSDSGGSGGGGGGGGSDGGDDGSSGGGSDSTPTEETLSVAVGSKTYNEQINLGYVAYELLANNTDHNVVDKTEFGGNQEIAKAYQSSDPTVHTYYDYMGSIWADHPPAHDEQISDPDEMHSKLKSEMESEHPVRITDRTNWQNTWAPFGKQATLGDAGLSTLSDLAEYVNGGNYDLTFALEQDFYGRGDGFEALMSHYGFEQEHLTAWEENGGILKVTSGPATGTAVDEGQADIGLGYSTSAWIAAIDGEVVTLDDDKGFWPSYHVVGIVHEDIATDEVFAELNKISKIIPDGSTMRSINQDSSADDADNQEVVRSFLKENGFI
jgi:osmoprotectant transport system substrate-binding protein